MFGLITALIGVGLTTLGVFLFFSNRFSKRVTRPRLGSEILSILLLVGGSTLLLSSAAFNVPSAKITQSFDPNRLMEEHPTAAGTSSAYQKVSTQRYPALPRFMLPYKHITVLAWGTPNDRDTADSAQITEYSEHLRNTVRELLRDYTTKVTINTPKFTRADYEVLQTSPLVMQKWCDEEKTDFIIALGIGPAKINGDYALWREPIYEALDCTTDQASRLGGRINERTGDRYPYQLSIFANISNLLDEYLHQR